LCCPKCSAGCKKAKNPKEEFYRDEGDERDKERLFAKVTIMIFPIPVSPYPCKNSASSVTLW
jgi:hypothetical protein